MSRSHDLIRTTTTNWQLVSSKKRVASIVFVLLLINATMLSWAATKHSPTLNEPAHLVAGLSHWELHDYSLYKVNPPLTRLLASLPVVLYGYESDWSQMQGIPGSRPELPVAEYFMAANGTRCINYFVLARWACIPFSLVGALICFFWSRDICNSNIAGLISMTVWCFEPNIMAHGELITPDCAATSLGLAAGYFFYRWLVVSSWKRALLAGALLGLAEVTKMSWVILFPLWPLLWLLKRILWSMLFSSESKNMDSLHTDTHSTSHHQYQGSFGMEFFQMVTIICLCLYVLNAFYLFDGTGTPLRDCSFVSSTLNGLGVPGAIGNRFEDSLLGEVPIPVPKQYLLGLDVQNRDFEDYGYLNYLCGEFKDGGWWYYYSYGLLIKTAHGMHVLLLFSLGGIFSVVRCYSRFRHNQEKNNCDVSQEIRLEKSAISASSQFHLLVSLAVLITPASFLFVIASARTEINQHIRYVLPCIGVACVLAGASWLAVVFSKTKFIRHISFGAITSGLLWLVSTTLFHHPDCLAYFNEFAGGSRNGAKHLIHSNLDWGQGLLYLRRWMRSNPGKKPVHLAYHGFAAPTDFGIRDTLPVTAFFMPSDQPGKLQLKLAKGFYVISANLLMGYPAPARHHRTATVIPPEVFSALRQMDPIGHLGYSLIVYEIPEDMQLLIPIRRTSQ